MRSLSLSLLLLLTLGALGCRSETPPAGPPVALVSIPEPLLENYEPLVQEQLRVARRGLDSLMTQTLPEPATLGAALGEMGQHYLAHGLNEAAEACFQNARTLQPKDGRWPYYLGVITQRASRLDEAAAYLEQTLSLNPDDVPVLLRLGEIAFEQDSTAAARRLFERALAGDAQNATALFNLGRIAATERAFEEAIDQYQRALDFQPEASSVYHLLGQAYRQVGDLDAARAQLAKAGTTPVRFTDPLMDDLARFIEGARAYIIAGDEASKAGNVERALGAYRKAVEIDPQSALAQYKLGVFLGQRQADEEAMVYLRKAIELDPDYRDAHFNLATALSRLGRLGEASFHFDRVLATDPEDTEARLRKAIVLKTSGEAALALATLDTLLATDPTHGEAHAQRAAWLLEQDRAGEARQTLETALATPMPPEREAALRFVLATVLQQQNLPDEAIAVYKQIVEMRPDFVEAHVNLADALAMNRRYAEAAKHYAEALTHQPDHAGAHLGQAEALIAGGMHDAALGALEASLQTLPNDAALAHALARLLATSPNASVRDGARALQLSQQVYQATRLLQHGETIAMAMAEVGRFDDAVAWQRQLIIHARQSKVSNQTLQRLQRNMAQYERREAMRL